MHIFHGGAPGVKKPLSLDLLWTLIRDFQTSVERVRGLRTDVLLPAEAGPQGLRDEH